MTDDSDRGSSHPTYRPLVDEVTIPAPVDDTDGYGEDEGPPLKAEADADLASLGLALFHGRQVNPVRGGIVTLDSIKGQKPLRFSMYNKKATEILALGTLPTIHFAPDLISLRVNGETVYQKPIERLLVSKEGPEWLVQVTRELQRLQISSREEGTREQLVLNTELAMRPYQYKPGGAWINAELRRKFFGGAKFPCKPSGTPGRDMGFILIKVIRVPVPAEADFSMVTLRCDLADEGEHHPNCCTIPLHPGDPASRLGIQLKYNTKSDGKSKEVWARLSGDSGKKKLNTLVDFLEGKDEEWTETQPRRFLDRNKSRGRTKPCYTD